MKHLAYYSHRYGLDPANLARARQRFAELRALWAVERPDIVLWAPWLEMAEAGVDEAFAWEVIDKAIQASAMLVLDLDGEAMSNGMAEEEGIALFYGNHWIITIDGDITPAVGAKP